LAEADRLLKRTDGLKTYLLAASSLARQDPKRWHFATLEARAAAIIHTVAELESLTRFVIQETHRGINGKYSVKVLKPCIRQLAAHTTFESLRDLGDPAKVWARRAEATTLEYSSQLLALPIMTKTAQPPLDGRTLRPEHFSRIWAIYGLPGAPFPYISWEASMLKLAGARNDLAHGNVPFDEVFQAAGMGITHIESYVNDIAAFSIHLTTAWVDYLDNERFLAGR
jgi:hypothetical protein